MPLMDGPQPRSLIATMKRTDTVMLIAKTAARPNIRESKSAAPTARDKSLEEERPANSVPNEKEMP